MGRYVGPNASEYSHPQFNKFKNFNPDKIQRTTLTSSTSRIAAAERKYQVSGPSSSNQYTAAPKLEHFHGHSYHPYHSTRRSYFERQFSTGYELKRRNTPPYQHQVQCHSQNEYKTSREWIPPTPSSPEFESAGTYCTMSKERAPKRSVLRIIDLIESC